MSKVVELVGEGTVTTGATLSSFDGDIFVSLTIATCVAHICRALYFQKLIFNKTRPSKRKKYRTLKNTQKYCLNFSFLPLHSSEYINDIFNLFLNSFGCS